MPPLTASWIASPPPGGEAAKNDSLRINGSVLQQIVAELHDVSCVAREIVPHVGIRSEQLRRLRQRQHPTSLLQGVPILGGKPRALRIAVETYEQGRRTYSIYGIGFGRYDQ